ncbi:MAG: hypothetical protein SFU98_22785 [Leptospiraceae bacterium]|nr:hypothetical protein [Leptospiraceae bacterium]
MARGITLSGFDLTSFGSIEKLLAANRSGIKVVIILELLKN